MDHRPLTQLGPEKAVSTLILYVGDDQSVFDHLLERLLSSGFTVRVVETMSAVWRTVLQLSPFAVVIDATQPTARWRPWELCRDLSDCQRFPVIMVFDGKDGSGDRAKAFEHGADQCFHLGPSFYDELAAYFEMQRSRLGTFAAEPRLLAQRDPRIRIDWETRQVARGDHRVSLSPKEFALLQLLTNHSGHVVTEREILKALWKRTQCPAARANLKQVVKHLRAKIEVDPQHPKYLVNIRGIGYRLQVDLRDASDRQTIDTECRDTLNDTTQ